MYSLSIWKKSDEPRIYVHGTTRSDVYFVKGPQGQTVWTSRTANTPMKFRKGDHWGKIRRDREAAQLVAERFGLVLGETPFEEALSVAAMGLELPS